MRKLLIALCLVASTAWGGMELDGVNDRVVVEPNVLINTMSDFSASAWVYANSLGEGGYGRILCKRNNPIPNFLGWELILYDTLRVDFILDYSTNTDLNFRTSNNSFTLNKLVHIVAVKNGATAKIYFDGVEQSYSVSQNGVGTQTDDSTLPLWIGDRQQDQARNFDGKIYSVQIFPRALTANEVKSLYNSGGLAFPNDGTNVVPPVAEWYGATGYGDGQTLTNGTVITDYSGNGLHGYATNGVKQVSVQVSTNAAGFTTPIPVQRIKRRK